MVRHPLLTSDSCGVACFVDVETTGLDPSRHEVIELALALFAFRRDTGLILAVLDEYVGLRQPRRPIPLAATRIHRITDADVRGQVLDLTRVEELLGSAEFLVAHNARFDMGFMVQVTPLARARPWQCSMSGVRWERAGFDGRSLQHLLRCHGLEGCRAHRAQADVRSALALLAMPNRDGVPYLAELLESKPVWSPGPARGHGPRQAQAAGRGDAP